MRFFTTFLLMFFLFVAQAQTKKPRPTIGLTLSGGGAKGLAHIGILKALDSAGLRADVVTGTSMGSIVGAMYASGYSADTILKMARKIDWDLLLTNASSLSSLIMDEKDEYGKYAVELPWVNGSFRLPSGVLESEELWLKFNEYFFPVYNIKNFDQLPRSFACIATDVSTGEGVVLKQGELVRAVRSSVAIPTVFTAVDYDKHKLIDGGIVRNFPVQDAKNLGADIVVGSNVAGGLLAKDKINNVFQVLLQVAFFREDADSKKERKLCDVYIGHNLEDYTMGSFAAAQKIIDEGIDRGKEMYPRLKQIADSLRAIYGVDKRPQPELPKVDSVLISSYQVNGLSQTTEDFFLHRMQFKTNRWYTAKELSDHIRKTFGTRYYKKIVYSLHALDDGSCKVVFDVEENALTFSKLGIHYNSFTGISLIGNITTRDFFTPHSRSTVTLNLGENMRLRGEHLQFFGKYKTLAVNATTQVESISINTYKNFKKDGEYRQNYFLADLNAHIALNRKYLFALGTRFEAFHYKPKIASVIELRGRNNVFNTYAVLHLNTLSNAVYSHRGSKIDIEGGYVFNQHPNIRYFNNGNEIKNLDSLGFGFGNFIRTRLNAQYYFPVASHYTLFTQVQAGINFNQKESILNNYYIGGLNNTFHNQITFAGLDEGSLRTSSVATLQLGLRYQMFNNLFVIGRANALYHDFVGSNKKLQNANLITGYALTLGYNFVLGPLEVSAMYCDKTKQLLPYINLGIPF